MQRGHRGSLGNRVSEHVKVEAVQYSPLFFFLRYEYCDPKLDEEICTSRYTHQSIMWCTREKLKASCCPSPLLGNCPIMCWWWKEPLYRCFMTGPFSFCLPSEGQIYGARQSSIQGEKKKFPDYCIPQYTNGQTCKLLRYLFYDCHNCEPALPSLCPAVLTAVSEAVGSSL